MPNWLIPAGELLFPGNETKLRAAVGSLDGKLKSDGSFTCKLGGGPSSFRFHMATVFRGKSETVPGGIRITWRALPAPGVLALFAALVLMALAGLFTTGLELAGWMLCLLGLLGFLYLIQRSNCVEQFTATFTPSEQTKGAS